MSPVFTGSVSLWRQPRINLHQHIYEKADLVLKYLRGDLSAAEADELRHWLAQDERARLFLESLDDETAFVRELEFHASLNVTAAWQKVAEQTEQKKEIKLGNRLLHWKYAAVTVLVLSIGLLVSYQPGPGKPSSIAQKRSLPKRQTDVSPGRNKARLELADGSTLLLEQFWAGAVRAEGGAVITNQNGQLVYQANPVATTQPVGFNKVTTPKGGQYQVILPDGSRVTLNAGSSLRFPTAFSGIQRGVELSGEAYFEIAKNGQMPFVVQAGKVRVEVLGTEFNVMAYANESSVNTTLLEGSVKVSTGTDSRMISPGHQGRVSAGIEIIRVDTEEVTAWQKGLFQFNDSDLQSVMRQLERWYDVEIAFEGKISDRHFSGLISRNTNLSQVLKMLELTGGVKFRMEERRVTVL